MRTRLQNELYLSISTFGAGVHLAVVFGVVVIERRLAVTEPDHAAVVRVLVPVVAEQLPAVNVSAKEREKNFYSDEDFPSDDSGRLQIVTRLAETHGPWQGIQMLSEGRLQKAK